MPASVFSKSAVFAAALSFNLQAIIRAQIPLATSEQLPRIQYIEKLQKKEQKQHSQAKLKIMGPARSMLAASDASFTDALARSAFLDTLPVSDLAGVGFTNVILVDAKNDSWITSVCADHYSPLDQVVTEGKLQPKPPVRLELAPRVTYKGLLIDSVFQGGASADVDIHSGDILTSLAGRKVETTFEMTEALAGKKPGERIDLSVIRDGKELVKSLTLAGESGTAPVSPWPTAYKRRNYQLGLLLSQFKYMAYPDDNTAGKIVPACSDNPKVALELYSPKGIVTCGFFDGTEMFPSLTGLQLGDIYSLTRFFFVSKDGSEEPRLFVVSSEGPATKFSDLLETFSIAYGKPTSVEHAPFQTKSGSTFQNTIVSWENDVSTITLENFGETIEKLQVKHTLKPLLAVYGQMIGKDQAEKAKKL